MLKSRFAAIQMCSTHIVDQNLEMAADLIKQAYEEKANCAVLPEMFSILGLNMEDKIHAAEAASSGKVQEFLSKQAKEYGMWIVGGTIPLLSNDPNKVYAASLVFDDQGELQARYDKIHLFDVVLSEKEIYQESHSTQAGNHIVVFDSPFGKIGIAVCYDIRFPELFRTMFNQGVEIICLPAAFTAKTGEAHWEILLRSRAIENFSYVIGAAEGGVHTSGRKTHGHSMIVDPWGKIIAENQGVNPGVIVADIDLDYLRSLRTSLPVAFHQRIFFDTSGLD